MVGIPDDICGICYHPKSEVYHCRHPNCDVCRICRGSGWNHGIQVTPNKKHPTGWKSEPCECTKYLTPTP